MIKQVDALLAKVQDAISALEDKENPSEKQQENLEALETLNDALEDFLGAYQS